MSDDRAIPVPRELLYELHRDSLAAQVHWKEHGLVLNAAGSMRNARRANDLLVQPVTEEPAEWPGDVLTCDINQLSGWLDACLDGIDRTQFRSIGWLRDFQQLTAAPPSEASR